MEHSAIAVISHSPIDEIVEQGSVGAWVLDPAKANKQTYVVCCQQRTEGARLSNLRYAAFLVGRISKVIPLKAGSRGDRRFKIVLSNYAIFDINLPWPEWRNPVRYTTLEAMGINPLLLDFHQIFQAEGAAQDLATEIPRRVRKLSLDDAKEGLAAMFGVDPSKIEIVIRS